MSFAKLPAGTRGMRTPPHWLMAVMKPVMTLVHRRSGDRFRGNDLLYLTTVGARSGERRTTPVARFDDGAGGWVVVASYGGAAQHPAWYHNIAAHPDQVEAEVAGRSHRVRAEQLEGEERERAWTTVVSAAPSFLEYTEKTDRVLPVLRLTPLD